MVYGVLQLTITVDHRIILSFEMIDFGQSVTSSNVVAADGTTSSAWTDRIGVDTMCRDAMFYVEMSFNPNNVDDKMTLCPRTSPKTTANEFRRKRTPFSPGNGTSHKNVTLATASVIKKDLFDLDADLTTFDENDVLKSDERVVAKTKKRRIANVNVIAPFELVSIFGTNLECSIISEQCYKLCPWSRT